MLEDPSLMLSIALCTNDVTNFDPRCDSDKQIDIRKINVWESAVDEQFGAI